MSSTYILYSEILDAYYVGATASAVEDRLKKHLTNHKGFTGKAKDWKIVWVKTFESERDAFDFERKIKSWKSRAAIEKLIGA